MKKFDLDSIRKATENAKYRIDEILIQANKIVSESEQENKTRIEKQECKVCCYISGRCGGNAMSSRPCALCEKEIHSGNTCVNLLCKDCAKKNNLCVYCGGDIELKMRRKFEAK